ncbi:MAG TPA: radical SAM protein [Solirubrobacterales bacterium]|nr:radical SAM protein [Solirubrobacterales bacterium]
MRWDEQRVEKDLRLPGIGDGTVVRTFDAPEAMGINFHEVRARSALNHVPGESFGFSWTINPYRGCTHACVFCLDGATPILLADGRSKPLADVRVGDAIYGTVKRGNYRRYEVTEVLAHWATRKPGYRITLEDGTELIASGDHRFLTDRGWRYVTGTEAGPGQRPFLTTNNKLMGIGSLGRPGEENKEYRRGYLCGMIRGDGSIGSYSYERPGRTRDDHHRFRLALTDAEALGRSRDYLAAAGIRTDEFEFLRGSDRHRPMRAIRTSSHEDVGRVRGLIERPRDPSADWHRGFLAGTFDAGGSIAGIALKSPAKLGVVSIEPLGKEVEMFDISTGTEDFIADGVVSHNCFARKTHTYLDMDAGRDFEREIVVKVNVPELVRAELARPSWKRDLVALGTNTDPYQWCEGRYRMLPEILEALLAAETPVSVLTKSPLVMRDIEIFERFRDAGLRVSVNLSVPTLDEKAWRLTEPHTPSPSARLDAVAELRKRGIDSGILIAPLMPGINDQPEQVEPIIARAREAGATFLGGVALHLRGEVKDVYFGWLREKRPDLVPEYERLYGRRAYMRPEDRKKTTRALRGWGQQRMRSNYIEGAQKTEVGAEKKTSGPFARAPKEPAQSKLF